jgi:DNA replication protein DnaC
MAHKAMQLGYTARYARLPRLLHEMQVAKASNSYLHLLASLARVDVLAIDDWGLSPLDGEQRRDFLELVEDRYATRSLLMASQLPVDQWFDTIGDATIADAIMDRIVHCAHRLDLRARESGRKTRAVAASATKKEAKK